MGDSDDDTFSDGDGPETAKEVKASDIVLSQMRRGAQKRGGHSKLKARYEGLQNYGEMMKAHALKRMQDGLRKLLSLHSATELSSLSGCLGLKAQLKGANSIEQILKYASETEEMNEDKITNILNYMWEGALWEYLHSIGHPVHSMLLDPKKTILKIWEEGGLIQGSTTFIPHFIAREVKKRYEWVQSEDIKTRLDKLRIAQETTKRAERKVVSEHDYTNILTYFSQMADLRKLENSVREYLISELEIARSRVDSSMDTAAMTRAQIAEGELYFIRVADALNEKLAYTECVCDTLQNDRYATERDLQRLTSIVDSYTAAELSRETPGGGVVSAHTLCDEGDSSKSIRLLHKKLQQYHRLRNTADNTLRDRTRGHIEEIDRLEVIVREYEEELSEKIDECYVLEERANRAENELKVCARRLMKGEIRETLSREQSWASAIRFASRTNELERKMHVLKPLLIAGLGHKKNKVCSDICRTLLTTLPIIKNKDEYNTILETFTMTQEDNYSKNVRKKYNKDKAAEESERKAKLAGMMPPTSKSGTKSPTKGSTKPGSSNAKKKPGSAGSGSDSESARSKNSATTAKSSSSAARKPGSAKSSTKPSTPSIKEKPSALLESKSQKIKGTASATSPAKPGSKSAKMKK